MYLTVMTPLLVAVPAVLLLIHVPQIMVLPPVVYIQHILEAVVLKFLLLTSLVLSIIVLLATAVLVEFALLLPGFKHKTVMFTPIPELMFKEDREEVHC